MCSYVFTVVTNEVCDHPSFTTVSNIGGNEISQSWYLQFIKLQEPQSYVCSAQQTGFGNLEEGYQFLNFSLTMENLDNIPKYAAR